MTSKSIIFTLLVTTALLVARPVYADGCNGQYGGQYGDGCPLPNNLNINKQVQDPMTGLYVENVTTPKFSQGNKVVFKLIVTNTSGETFFPVYVNDTVPENLVIDDADVTKVNKDGKKKIKISSDKKHVKVEVDELPAGASFDVYIWTHLVGTYPTDDQFCRDNWADVHSPQRPEGDKNFARFCVANKVLGASTLPTAGASDLLYMLPFALSGLGGIAIMRKK